MKVLKTRKTSYSFEQTLEVHFRGLQDQQLKEKFISLRNEMSETSFVSGKIGQMLKMVKRELINRNIEIA